MVVVVATVVDEEADAVAVLRGISARANPVMGRSLGTLFACEEEEEEGTRIGPERDATLALAVATPATL